MVLTIQSRMQVSDVSGREITDFLLTCTDPAYRAWWPGTHRQLHQLASGRGGDHVGDVVFMDEMIGRRRVRMTGVVRRAVPGREIVWQLGGHGRVPVRLALELIDRDGGVDLQHTITAGWGGVGRVADPLFRLYFTRRFAAAMDAHVHTEFPLLRDRLRAAAAPRDKAGDPASLPGSGDGPAEAAGPQHLRPPRLLDHRHPTITALVDRRGWARLPVYGRIGAVYDYVREEIRKDAVMRIRGPSSRYTWRDLSPSRRNRPARSRRASTCRNQTEPSS